MTRAPKPIEPLAHPECLDAVRAASRAYATAANMPPRYASRSWFLNEFARRLGQAKRTPGGGRPALQVTTECDTTSLGNFYQLIRRPFESPIDVLACVPWGRLQLSSEDYGTDEEFLPPFYLLKLLFDRRDTWIFPEEVANGIMGPLTVTVISVNLLGAEGSFHAAMDFERQMKEKNVAHHVSTQFLIPGILATVTSAEPTEPHQVLIASQTFEREPVPNAEYGSVRE